MNIVAINTPLPKLVRPSVMPMLSPLLAAALVALVLWMAIGTKSYVISVPCEVVPAEKRHLAAPFEGTIAAAHVKPGEHVVAGQLLVELDMCLTR